jgi:hypothetical protein
MTNPSERSLLPPFGAATTYHAHKTMIPTATVTGGRQCEDATRRLNDHELTPLSCIKAPHHCSWRRSTRHHAANCPGQPPLHECSTETDLDSTTRPVLSSPLPLLAQEKYNNMRFNGTKATSLCIRPCRVGCNVVITSRARGLPCIAEMAISRSLCTFCEPHLVYNLK